MMPGLSELVAAVEADENIDGSTVKVGTAFAAKLTAEKFEQLRAEARAEAGPIPPPTTAKPEPVNAGPLIEPVGGGDPYGPHTEPSNVGAIIDSIAAGGGLAEDIGYCGGGYWA